MVNVMVAGSGGREHVLAWCLAKSPKVDRVFVAPGNGGTTNDSKIASLPVKDSDQAGILKACQEHSIGLVVVGPEQPLCDGLVDFLGRHGIPAFGPSATAAQLEGSKAFSKDFMARHGIPTAAYKVFGSADVEAAVVFARDLGAHGVVKASGLAAGKGVVLPTSADEAEAAVRSVLVDKTFGGAAGERVVVEELLTGPEVSIFAFSDGYTVKTLPGSQDHKRIFEGDQGPNTGGMGAYCPTPFIGPSELREIHTKILQPTIDGMRKEGHPFKGLLYAGLMMTPSGPKVLEYNVRFGDPETQGVLRLLTSDLYEIMMACCGGYLDAVPVKYTENASVATVVLVSGGYPGSYPKDKAITINESKIPNGCQIFHAGTKLEDDKLVTSGGRVLAVTAVSQEGMKKALDIAYEGVKAVEFEGMFYRKDIGHQALKVLGEQNATAGSGMTYAAAGVNIDEGARMVELIKPHAAATNRPGTEGELGGFGGLFDLRAAGYTDPVLVSGTDGVGTKLLIAQSIGVHDTIGVDLVAMSVNDILTQGAEPLYFLDYYACGRLSADIGAAVVKGIAAACAESGCALLGGETAEMPGMYSGGASHYDLAGFAVGAVERTAVLPRSEVIADGDVLLGVPSSGIHSNGFSLVRRVVEAAGLSYASTAPWETSVSIGQSLLTPTALYVKPLLPVIRKHASAQGGPLRGLVHITGGGFPENLPRVLPKGSDLCFNVALDSWPLLPVFAWLQKAGNITSAEMAKTFNCGIGMVLIVSQNSAATVQKEVETNCGACYVIGSVGKKTAVDGDAVVLNGDFKA
eukprot:Clim_evm31s201 gene=Clim_evmTU31s201